MSFAEWLAQPACRLLMLTLLHFLWQGTFIALGLAALVKVCNVSRPTTSYALSLVALVMMMACPIATLAWMSFGLEISSDSRPPTWTELATTDSDLALPVDRGVFSMGAGWIDVCQPYVLSLWVAGVVFFGSRLVMGAIGTAKLRRGRLSIPSALAARVERVGQRLQINAVGLVFLSNHVTEAMALGLFRRLVLIPAAWATEMPLDMLEAVIAHELAHLKRLDLWTNLLQRVVETLFFYHPAVWWLSRRLRIERELCSDELAVAATGERLRYAQTLEHIARGRPADVRPALAAYLRGESNMRLLQRIRNVLAPSTNQRHDWPAGLVALGLATCLWILSLALFNALSPTAYAAQEPAQDEQNGQDKDREQKKSKDKESDKRDQSDDAPVLKLTLDEDLTSEESELIERKVAEVVKRALAQAEKIKQEELDKASRKVDEKLAKVRLHHIELEKDARAKALDARKQATIKFQAAEKDKQLKDLYRFHIDERGAVVLPAEEAGKVAKARYRILVSDGEEGEVTLQQDNDERIDQLTAMVKKLSAQVDRLSKELKDLRAGDERRNDDGEEDELAK
jgi:beta-lactamase regulating signal transducer with metallopeptidase domain